MHRKIQIVAFVTVLCGLLQGCCLPGLGGHPSSNRSATMTDVQFAQSAFTALANGDQSVQDDIDWENFQALSQNVGAKYSAFQDEPNRAAFRGAFITSFSASYHSSGGSAESLTNWTTKIDGADQAVISAQYPNGNRLAFTISKKSGVKKISIIQIGM